MTCLPLFTFHKCQCYLHIIDFTPSHYLAASSVELSVLSSFSKRLSSLLCERWCGDDREMVLPLPGLTVLARTVDADPVAAITVDTVVDAAEPGLFT